MYELSFVNGENEIIIGTYNTVAEAEKPVQQLIDDANREYDIAVSKWNDNLKMYVPVKSI